MIDIREDISPRKWNNLRDRARRWMNRAKASGNAEAYGAIRHWHWLYQHGCRTAVLYHNLEVAIDLVASVYKETRRSA